MDNLIRLNSRADGHYAFLFTDIEGSTKRWAMFPGEMGAALTRLDAVLSNVIRANRGEVFKNSGDGGHAVFVTVSAALAAAVALQSRMEAEDFGAVGRLKLRIGVHCGPAAFRDGDYFGLTLNRTARIMAAGHGGQILISAAAAEAAGAGFAMRSLGAHRLKDLAQAEELFQLAGPGLAAEFPPLRALNEKPNNLPLQPNAFFGREEELAALRELLASHKLVTLLGPGGIGKTRLALQAGADALDDYTDGVFVVELAGVSEAVQVVAASASALNITLSGGDAPAEQLASALRGAAMLIILDNCEHLIEAASGLTAAILQRNAGVTILATSRSPLGLPGEQSLALPTLPVPEAGAVAGITADGAAGFASVQLFVARAGLVQPGFALADKNAADIAAICQRLDGIALAIELAAARTRLMRPQDLLARLNDRFQLLTGGPRTNATRQQTLRATIDWSFDLLNESERMAFRRLGVFAGSFDLPGAEAVLQGGPIGALDVLDLVAGLLDKSLITRLPAEEREPRYRLLDSTRHYALEKLEQAGEKDALQRAHALQMVAVLSKVARRYPDTDTIVWRADVEPEIENLRAALVWAFGNGGDDGIAIALVARMWPLVYEALIDWGMFRAFVRSAMKLLAPHTPREDEAMLWLGLCSDNSATARASAAAAATAQALFHDLGDRQMEALAASIAAYYLSRSGDTAGAEPAADVARVILRKIQPNLISARVLYILAAHGLMAAREAADFAAVLRDNDAALQIYKKFNNQTGILEVSANLADQQASFGDYAGAIESTKRNAAQNRARRDWRSLHFDLTNQATYCLLMGDDAAAARAAREALPHGLEPFDQGTSAAFTGSLALLAARAGALVTAAKLAGYTSSIDISHHANFQTVEQLVGDALMALFAQAENSAKLSSADRAQLMNEGAALSLEAALQLAAEFFAD